MLPPVTLPVAVINPAVLKLPPVTLAVTDTTVPKKLEPVTVPVALINPAVNKLPPVIFPVTVAATILPVRLNCPAVNKLVTTALLAELLPDAVTVTAVTSARL